MESYSDDDKELAIPIPKTDLGRAESMIFKTKDIIAHHVHFDGTIEPLPKLESELSWENQSTTVANKINDAIAKHMPDIDGIEIDNSREGSKDRDAIEREKHKAELEFLNKEVKKINPNFEVQYLNNVSYDLKCNGEYVMHFQEQPDYWFIMIGDTVPSTHLALKNLKSVLHFIKDINWTVSNIKHDD